MSRMHGEIENLIGPIENQTNITLSITPLPGGTVEITLDLGILLTESLESSVACDNDHVKCLMALTRARKDHLLLVRS